jgi:hypothetical protein
MVIHHLRLFSGDSRHMFFFVTFCGCVVVETDIFFEVDRHFDFGKLTECFKEYLDDFVSPERDYDE